MRRVFSLSLVLATLFSLMMMVEVAPVDAATSHASASSYNHIFYIMMENHGTNQIFTNTADAPYINQLADKYAISTNYYGVTHPSLPNYLAAISGSYQGIWDDCKAGATSTCAPQEFMSGAPYNKQLLTPAEVDSTTPYNHYTLLATIEKLWHLGCIENSCDFGDRVLMTKFFE